MRKRILIFFLFQLSFLGRAQLLDTIRDFLKHKYAVDVRLESRSSFIDNQLTSVTGFRIGLSFQRKLRIGAGLSWLRTDGRKWLKDDITKDFYILNDNGTSDTISKFLKFGYLCYYIDFVFYKTKHWQLSVPLQLGTGLLWYQEKKNYYFGNHEKKYLLFLYEPGITVQYKIVKSFGLGCDVAYRFALHNKEKTDVRMSSPSITFRVLFWVDQLFYDLFPKSKITKTYGPSFW